MLKQFSKFIAVSRSKRLFCLYSTSSNKITLFIDNIHWKATNNALMQYFNLKDEKDVFMPLSRRLDGHRGFAYVKIDSELKDEYITKYNKSLFHGNNLLVKVADEGKQTNDDHLNSKRATSSGKSR